MQRIFIGKSLRHIVAVFKSDWRMFIAICWLPLVLGLILKLGWRFSLPETKEMIFHSRYKFEIMANTYMAARAVLTSVMLVGIYRYLLSDPRFNLKSVRPNVSAISKCIRPIPFYFSIGKSTLILAVCLMMGTLLHRLAIHYVNGFVIDQMKGRPLSILSDMWLLRTNLMLLPIYLLSFLYFIISTQLCLIDPYIATANRITWQKVWQNITALKGNRWRVFAVPFIIELCLTIIGMIPFLTIYLIDQNDFLNRSMNWTRYASPVISIPLGFISLVVSAIFCAEIFKLLGSPNEDPQQNRPQREIVAEA